MNINPFKLERYFSEYEFNAQFLLSCSDCEPLTLADILEMADSECRYMWDSLAFGYTESQGHPILRQEISDMYENIGPEHVITAVPEEGILLFMLSLLKPGDHVVAQYPAYQSLYEIARSIGCSISFWKPRQDKTWFFDPVDLNNLVHKGTRLVVVNFPHNPTGFNPSHQDFLQVIEIARKQGSYLLCDEMYRFLEHNAKSLDSACDLYEKAAVLSGLSKAFGLPGLRSGWIVSRSRELIEGIAVLKDYTTICGSAPAEILSIIALRNRQRICSSKLDTVRFNLNKLREFTQNRPELFEWLEPAAGSICFPGFLHKDGASEFCRKMVRESGIMLVPSVHFDWEDSHVRFGYGRSDFPEILDKFGCYLDSET